MKKKETQPSLPLRYYYPYKRKKAPVNQRLSLVAGTGLEPVTFGL